MRTDRIPPLLDGGALARLLDAELDFDPVAEHGFTNHLAMGLVAAARLGADPDTLQRWYDDEATGGFIHRRTPRPAGLDADAAEIERVGIDAAVRAALPDLVTRIGGLFHWMIRLELAIDAGHPGQVANALRDWAGRARAGWPFPEPAGERSVAQLLVAVAEATREGEAGTAEHLVAVEQPWLRDLVAGVAPARDADARLVEIAAAVADLHWAADDFVTLHLVTGTRAARALAPYLGAADRQVLANGHLLAVAAATARAITGPLPTPAPLPDEDVLAPWSEAGAAAVASGDDHVVKLTYAAQLEHAATGKPVYRAIATRVAGLA